MLFMQMQAVMCFAQSKCNNQVFMSLLSLLLCLFQILIPLYSSILLFIPTLSLCPLSPFYLYVQLIPLCHQCNTTWYVCLKVKVDNLNLGKTPHLMEMMTYSWGPLGIFLDCFYELPSLWLELVDFHNKLQPRFELSSTFFTWLWVIILLRLNLSLV